MPTALRCTSAWPMRPSAWDRRHRPRAICASTRIVEAARKHGAEAIHPGYGFLSENAEFAAACEGAGLVFIGPSAASIRSMGSKTAARRIAVAAGVPVAPGTDHGVTLRTGARVRRERTAIRCCSKPWRAAAARACAALTAQPIWNRPTAMRRAKPPALSATPEMYVEKLIERPRHIEIQVLGDRHGNMVHLGERECSIQRRHQKVIEECPSPLMTLHPGMRGAMGEAAVEAARAAGYYNAGTVEFLVDADRRFYFLEMNTRLQVEHPVTELATGLDLVRLQIEIAAGARLPFTQDEVSLRGSAIECRIYAEDPANNFLPFPGKITRLAEPSGPGVRLDSGVYEGWTVPMDYDPLLAKLAVWAPTREHAVARALRALGEYHVGGIRTNIGFFRQILEDPEFRAGHLHTGFIEDFFRAHQSVRAARRHRSRGRVGGRASCLGPE